MPAAAVALLALLAAGCGTSHRSPPAPPSRAPAPTGAASVQQRFGGIPQAGAVLGSPRAPYTLFEFGDLQCPFCARFDREILPAVIERFVRTGRLRLEFHPILFIGPDSIPAAEATIAAGLQDRMWQFADLFYRNQQRENSGYVTSAFIDQIAAGVPGLDVAVLDRIRTSRAVVNALRRNVGLGKAGDVVGTPDFRLGPTGGVLVPFLRGLLPQPMFIARLGAAIAHVRRQAESESNFVLALGGRIRYFAAAVLGRCSGERQRSGRRAEYA